MHSKTLGTIFRGSVRSENTDPGLQQLPASSLSTRIPGFENGSADPAQALRSQIELLINPNSGAGLAQGASRAAGTPSDLNVTGVFESVAKNLDQLRAVTETQGVVIAANTAAVTSNTAKSVGQSLASVGKVAGGLLGGLSALPILSDVFKLFGFGGSSSSNTNPSVKYKAPSSVAFDQTLGGADLGYSQTSSYNNFGIARVPGFDQNTSPFYGQSLNTLLSTTNDVQPTTSGTTDQRNSANGANDNPSPTSGTISNTQVTVNVSAMDSRSFLDRSQDIAQAVREAMLNMHPINDVVNDL